MSTAYYNEIEPFAAQWLRNLIAKNLIAPGEVDERSIRDVQPVDLLGFDQCHFFAGIGVWSHALRCAGWSDARPVWTGSCPCQPFSVAGAHRGTADERHLWPEFFRIIRECQPATVIGEQVAGPAALAWYDALCADLEGAGYAVGAADLCAAGLGAPHIRQRLYWVANYQRDGLQGGQHKDDGEGAATVRRRLANSGAEADRLAHPTPRRQRIDGSTSGSTGHASQREPACGLGDASGARGWRDAGAVPGSQGEGSGERGRARGVSDEPVVAGSVGRNVPGQLSRGEKGADGAHKARGQAAPGNERGILESATSAEALAGCGMADADGWKSGDGKLQRSGRYLQQPENAPADFWSDAVWLPCSDGKARPVEPGTFPLAHGVAGRMGRLRAYGNALCATVAQAFVEAVMECAP